MNVSEQGLSNWSTVFYKNLAGTDRKWPKTGCNTAHTAGMCDRDQSVLTRSFYTEIQSGQLLYLDLTVHINVLNNSSECQFNNVGFDKNMTDVGSPIHQEAIVLIQQLTFPPHLHLVLGGKKKKLGRAI